MNAKRDRAKDDARAAIDAATRQLAQNEIAEPEWQRTVSHALAAAYLIDDDPRWQSGFDGDALLWRQARELILNAASDEGTFLDVGCATGHLMECLASWSLERGYELTMYGLELSPDLVRAARRRLPAWGSRIFEGNAIDWQPPRRFTYVRTSLEYVPPGREPWLLTRLLRDVVEWNGRLIVGPMNVPDLKPARDAFDAAGLPEPTVHSATDRNRKMRHVLWVERGAGAE